MNYISCFKEYHLFSFLRKEKVGNNVIMSIQSRVDLPYQGLGKGGNIFSTAFHHYLSDYFFQNAFNRDYIG